MRRQLLMVERQHRFDKAHNAGCGFQMAHVGLDRANQQWFFGGGAKDGAQRVEFNWIAQWCAGAVGFDIADRRRLDLGGGQGLPQ